MLLHTVLKFRFLRKSTIKHRKKNQLRISDDKLGLMVKSDSSDLISKRYLNAHCREIFMYADFIFGYLRLCRCDLRGS